MLTLADEVCNLVFNTAGLPRKRENMIEFAEMIIILSGFILAMIGALSHG